MTPIRSLKRRNKMEGLKLASRYSYVCERARLLKLADDLRNFFQYGMGDVQKIENILKGLASYDFYRKIAHLNNRDVFDEEVISFYWKGSPKLKGWEYIHNGSTLVPIIRLRMNLIEPELVDECVVHPARVTESCTDGDFWVKYNPIIKTKKGLKLNGAIELKVKNELGLELKKGDWVTIHFRRIIEKISKKEAEYLLNLTKKNLKNFNSKNQKA